MGLNLITKAEYKTYAGINSTNYDAEIDSLIIKVSQLVKTYCRRTFVDYLEDPKVEIFDGGVGSFILAESPVVAVQSVAYSDNYGQTYTNLAKYTDWYVSGYAVLPTNPAGWYPKPNGYKVTYLAGYENFPEDLKLAVLDLVTYYRQNDGSVHSTKAPGTNSVQIEHISTTNLPAHIKRILDMYVEDYV